MSFSDWTTQFEVARVEIHEAARLARRSPSPTDPMEASRRNDLLHNAKHFPTDPIIFYQMLHRHILESIYRAKQENPDDACDHQCIAYNQASVELEWYKADKPYYKLYPGIIGMLTSSDINVPSHLIHAPLKTICLRLPDDHGIVELQSEEGANLQTILIDELEVGEAARVSEKIGTNDTINQRRFIFWFDFGEGEQATFAAGRRMPVVAFQVLGIADEEASFEDNVKMWLGKGRIDWDRGLKISDETLLNGIRLAVGTCLLATNADKVLEADVLNRHVDRYRCSTDEEERKTLHQKAKNRGKYGWLVGREISLPSQYGCRETQGDSGVQRELKHSHLRRGHFHTVRYGPGRSLTKVKWFKPVVVRADLPAPETSRGYKTETL